MNDELYVSEADFEGKDGPGGRTTTEVEPIFDAAEFMRFGKDIFTQRSGVMDYTSIQWMQQNIGDEYRIHILDFQAGPDTVHLYANFVPLAPRKLLLNHDKPCTNCPLHSTFTYKGICDPTFSGKCDFPRSHLAFPGNGADLRTNNSSSGIRRSRIRRHSTYGHVVQCEGVG